MRLALYSSFIALLVACGGVDTIDDHEPGTTDELIGDPCASTDDCSKGCYLDIEDYPGGFCSVSCASDADCPSDAACVDRDGGVCLFTCGASGGFDCTFLGPGWRCDDKDRQGAGGQVYVCIGD
jgi:hypothetical protein